MNIKLTAISLASVISLVHDGFAMDKFTVYAEDVMNYPSFVKTKAEVTKYAELRHNFSTMTEAYLNTIEYLKLSSRGGKDRIPSQDLMEFRVIKQLKRYEDVENFNKYVNIKWKTTQDGYLVLEKFSVTDEKQLKATEITFAIPGEIAGKYVYVAPTAFRQALSHGYESKKLLFNIIFYEKDGVKVKIPDCKELFMYFGEVRFVDFRGADTSEAKSMSEMFRGGSSLVSLNLDNFNTKNVQDMQFMFAFCDGLKNLDVKTFDTQKVENMRSMFSGCENLMRIDGIQNFKTENVTQMDRMFENCARLPSLDLSGFNTKIVTSMNSLFYGCKNLAHLNLTNFETGKLEDISFMFRDCQSLALINVDNEKFKLQSLSEYDVTSIFKGCTNLNYNPLEKLEEYSNRDTCNDCINLLNPTKEWGIPPHNENHLTVANMFNPTIQYIFI